MGKIEKIIFSGGLDRLMRRAVKKAFTRMKQTKQKITIRARMRKAFVHLWADGDR